MIKSDWKFNLKLDRFSIKHFDSIYSIYPDIAKNMVNGFNSRVIRQVILDPKYKSVLSEELSYNLFKNNDYENWILLARIGFVKGYDNIVHYSFRSLKLYMSVISLNELFYQKINVEEFIRDLISPSYSQKEIISKLYYLLSLEYDPKKLIRLCMKININMIYTTIIIESVKLKHGGKYVSLNWLLKQK